MEETHGTKHLPPTAEIEELFAAQQRKAPELARMDAAARRARLRRIVAYLQEHLGEAQAALQADLRRAPIDTTAEMLMVKSEADFIGRHLERWMRPQRVRPSLLSLGTTSQIRYEPKGNVLILGTWNAPFACNLVPAIGAIAAGNAVILKPSELAPHAAAFLGRMISTLFAPEEVAVVEGGAKRAAELLEHPFNHIYFTGSSAVGRIVMRAAARHLASVTLEMGGK
ncbi:MAG: aldehyde dehydrogenase family protein, partial [Deltaproteobacteria bacterium]